jgi:hypothetical protein
MKQIYRFSSAIFAALLICAICAAGAAARQPRLVLSHEGTPLAGTTELQVSIGENGGKPAPFTCFVVARGPIKNSSPAVRLTPTEQSNACFSPYPVASTEYTMTGHISALRMLSSGGYRVVGALTISEPGKCSYVFRQLGGSALSPLPDTAIGLGTATGQLAKGSSVSCETTQAEPLTIVPLDEGLFVQGELVT